LVGVLHETKLAQPLDLPVATRTMRYSAPVTQDDLKKAEVAARAASADPQWVEQFLQTWPPWQQAQRGLAAKALQYNDIESTRPTAEHANSQCIVSQGAFSELQEPVTKMGMTWVAERSELMTWWVEHGTDPTNREDLPLTQLRRLRSDVP
jgi:hypothetical protein